ncbi:MAG: DUF721 domain-containing protein [Fibrobacterales bacterium]
MMRKKQTMHPVSGIIGKVLKDPAFSGVKSDTLVRDNWSRILGPQLSASIAFIGLQGETILISGSSTASKNEFIFMQSDILDKIRVLIAPTEVNAFKFF